MQIRFSRLAADQPVPSHASPEFGLSASAKTDAAGKFELGGLVPGRLSGTATRTGYIKAPQHPVDPDQANQQFLRGAGDFLFDRSARRTLRAQAGAVIDGADFWLIHDQDRDVNQIITASGSVVDPDGNPAVGVRVSAFYPTGGFNGSTMYGRGRSTLTDGEGKYSITDYRQYLSHLMVLPTDQASYFGRGESRLEETIQLQWCSGITGTITDDQDRPLEGVSVTAYSENHQLSASWNYRSRSAETDADGRFEIGGLPPGACRIQISKAGFQAARALVFGPPGLRSNDPYRLTLNSGEILDNLRYQLTPVPALTELSGRLVEQSGAPLAGWQVGSGKTDSEGKFTTSVSPDNRALTARFAKGGYDTGLQVTIDLPQRDVPARPDAPLPDFAITVGGRVTGRVVLAEAGEPPGTIRAEISYHRPRRQGTDAEPPAPAPPDVPRSFAQVASVRFTAADLLAGDGSFLIDNIPPGVYQLQLSGEEIANFETTIRVGDDLHTDLGELRVPAGRVVAGRFVDAATGEPISSATHVFALETSHARPPRNNGQLRLMDDDSRFRITQLPADVDALVIYANRLDPNRGIRSANRSTPDCYVRLTEVDTSGLNEVDLGDVKLRSYRLVGRLVDIVTLEPVAPKDLNVRAVRITGGPSRARHTESAGSGKPDADGRFTIERYRPDAERLELQVSGYLLKTLSRVPPRRTTASSTSQTSISTPGRRSKGSCAGRLAKWSPAAKSGCETRPITIRMRKSMSAASFALAASTPARP